MKCIKNKISMKDKYLYNIKLRCVVCGCSDKFDYNQDKTYIKCTNCDKEYLGGYDELVSYNQDQIEDLKNNAAKEIKQDIQKEFNQKLKEIFKGNKFIKLK